EKPRRSTSDCWPACRIETPRRSPPESSLAHTNPNVARNRSTRYWSPLTAIPGRTRIPFCDIRMTLFAPRDAPCDAPRDASRCKLRSPRSSAEVAVDLPFTIVFEPPSRSELRALLRMRGHWVAGLIVALTIGTVYLLVAVARTDAVASGAPVPLAVAS